ncbi:uncharacterized protein LOC119998022 [Tripterygium wilfordii]|uniref:uncharacterized protein LOC119998022 n=1 Tax=Tripterygium wilfordii TaxID=458696 RepID=UPI0018F8496D|nr:uncharacterized protein LOC119998022 [Tripterygium wilfordii]
MGLNRILKLFCFLLCFLFLLVKSSSVLNHESIQPKIDDPKEASHYRVLYMKKTKPFFLDKQEVNKRRKRRLKNKKMMKEFKTSSGVSAMLPKGFVPPSGSGTPCHNQKHNSDFTFCDLSTANNNKP